MLSVVLSTLNFQQNMEYFGYRKLATYVKARELVRVVYALLKTFPREEMFALCSQIRRAAVSITSNIAEGMTRYSNKEKVHFLEMSYGSLMELMSQFEVALDQGYISDGDFEYIETFVADVARLLSGLQRSFMENNNNKV